jgi:hypothetical protein
VQGGASEVEGGAGECGGVAVGTLGDEAVSIGTLRDGLGSVAWQKMSANCWMAMSWACPSVVKGVDGDGW